MQLQDSSIEGMPAKTFDDRPQWRAVRRADLEKVVRSKWEAHGLPLETPWHLLRKTDLEQMANTLGILGDLGGGVAHKKQSGGTVVEITDEDEARARDAARDKINKMKHFGFLALARKLDVIVPDKPTPQEKAAAVEQMLTAMEDI